MTSKLISLGQILDQSWEFYTKNFKTLMKITAWFFLVPLLTLLGSLLAPSNNLQFLIQQNLLTAGNRIGMIITILAGSIVASVVAIWIFLSLVKATDELINNKKVDLKKINNASWKIFLPYLLMSLIRGAVFFLTGFAAILGVMLINASLSYSNIGFSSFAILVTIIGAITGLIFLIILWVWLAFPGYEIVLKGQGAIQSLKASKALVKGRFWSVFWRLLIPKLIFSVTLIIIQVIIFQIFLIIIRSISLDPIIFVRLSDLTGDLVLTALTALSLPMFIVADYLIFNSLKKN